MSLFLFNEEIYKVAKNCCSTELPSMFTRFEFIENIWAILKNKARKHAARSLKELRTFVEEEFHQIPDSVIEKSISKLTETYFRNSS